MKCGGSLGKGVHFLSPYDVRLSSTNAPNVGKTRGGKEVERIGKSTCLAKRRKRRNSATRDRPGEKRDFLRGRMNV